MIGLKQQSSTAREKQQLCETSRMLGDKNIAEIDTLIQQRNESLHPIVAIKLLEQWPAIKESYSGEEYVVSIREREIRTTLQYETLSGLKISEGFSSHNLKTTVNYSSGLLLENLPGSFPYHRWCVCIQA